MIKNEIKGGLISFNNGDVYYKATSEEIKSTLKSTKVHNKSIDKILKFSNFAQAKLKATSFDKYISINEIVKRAEQLAKYDKECLSHIKSKNMVLKELEKREKDTERIFGLYKRDKSNKTSSMFSGEREEAIKILEESKKSSDEMVFSEISDEMVFSEISEKHFKMDKDNTDYEPRDIFTEYQIEETEPKKIEEKIEKKLGELKSAITGDEDVSKFRMVTMAQLPTIKYNKEWNTLIELLKEQMQTNIPPDIKDDSDFAFLSSLKENITQALVNLIHSAASNVSLAQLEPIYNSVLMFMQHVSPIIHKTGTDSKSKKYYYELSLCLNETIIKFIVVDDLDAPAAAQEEDKKKKMEVEQSDAAQEEDKKKKMEVEQSDAAPIVSNEKIFNPFEKFDLEKKDDIKTFFEKTKIQHLNKLFELITTTTAFFMIYSLNIIRLLYSNIEHDFVNIDTNDKNDKKDYEIMIINAKELLSSYLHNSYNTGNGSSGFDSLEVLKNKLINSNESAAFKILYYNILQKNSFSELADSQPKHNKTLRLFSTKISSIIKKASQLKKFLEDGLIKVEELIKSYNDYKYNLHFKFEEDTDDQSTFQLYISNTILELQKIKVEILIEIELLINLLNKLKEKSYELVYGLLQTSLNTQANFDNCIDDLYELNNLINEKLAKGKISDDDDGKIRKKIDEIKLKKNKLADKVCDILYLKRYKKSNDDSDFVEYDLESFSDSEAVSNFISQYYNKKDNFTDDERSLRLYYGSLYNTNKIIKEWHIKNLSLYIELRNKVIKAQLYDITMLETIFYAVFNVYNKNKDIAAEAVNKALFDLINAIKKGLITNHEKASLHDNKAFFDILYQNLLEIKKIVLKLEKLENIQEGILAEIKSLISYNDKILLPKLLERDHDAKKEQYQKEGEDKMDLEEAAAAKAAEDLIMQEAAEAAEAGEVKEAEKEEAKLIENIEDFLSIINIELKVLNPLKQLDIFKEACKFYNKGFTEKEEADLNAAKEKAKDNAKGKGKGSKLELRSKKLEEKVKKMNAAKKKIERFEKFEIFKDNIGEYPNKNDSFRIFMKEKMEYLNILFEILCNNKNISSLIKSLKTLKKEEDKTDLGMYLDFGSENILDKDSGTFVDNSYMDPPSTNS